MGIMAQTLVKTFLKFLKVFVYGTNTLLQH